MIELGLLVVLCGFVVLRFIAKFGMSGIALGSLLTVVFVLALFSNKYLADTSANKTSHYLNTVGSNKLVLEGFNAIR